jgi:hypothetical protein
LIPSYNNKQRDLIFSLHYINKFQDEGSKKNKELANNSKNQAVVIERHKLKTTSKNPKPKKSLFASIMFEQKSGVCNCWVCKTITGERGGKEAA